MGIRGTIDLYGIKYDQYENIKKRFLNIAEKYGAKGIQTSALDTLDLFVRTSGADADICQKEMFLAMNKNAIDAYKNNISNHQIVDEEKQDLTVLKPEGTAPVIRALYEQKATFNQYLKVAYFDRMYRYNRPQKGRLREFTQAGMEFFGKGALIDAQCLAAAYKFMQSINLDKYIKIHINTMGNKASKEKYAHILQNYFKANQEKISTQVFAKAIENPLRALDKLTNEEKNILKDLPKMFDYLDIDSQQYFNELIAYLTQLQIPFHIDHTIVRGLDYYTHTVFEFISTLSASQGTVLAGGRYDNLISLITNKNKVEKDSESFKDDNDTYDSDTCSSNMPGVATNNGTDYTAIGWAAGVERLMLLLEECKEDIVSATTDQTIHIISLNTHNRCLDLQHKLHNQDLNCIIIQADKLDKALKHANQQKVKYVVISGTNESISDTWQLKNMHLGQQILCNEQELLQELKK